MGGGCISISDQGERVLKIRDQGDSFGDFIYSETDESYIYTDECRCYLSCKSLIITSKRKGPNQDPWGTEPFKSSHSETS